MLQYAIYSFVICLAVGGGAWIYAIYDVKKSQQRRVEFQKKIDEMRKGGRTPAH
jgi:hypothetical protein